jgi:1-acyl-sn-glycerol-3-phosphate acyltransferase
MIRTAWVWANALVLTVLYGSWVVLLSRFRWGGTERVCERLGRRWARRILKAAGVQLETEGLEVIGPNRPRVIVCNHESWFDVFAIVSAFPGGCRFVAKKELASVPFFGPAWLACGHISIDRQDRCAAIQSLDEAARQVKESSHSIIMFPEGTRSPTGKLQEFKKGAFVLAIQAGTPVVPVAVIGGRGIMPKGSFRVRPGRILIRAGEPIPVKGLDAEGRHALRETAWRRIAQLKGESPKPLDHAVGSGEA